jgi:hypothetical protein
MRPGARTLAVVVACATTLLAACPRRPREAPQVERPPERPGPTPVDAAVSDVATGGSWEQNGQSGVIRVVVRSGGRRDMRSDVVLQWLRWDAKAEQPIEVRSVPISGLRRGGIIVTATRIDDEDGRTVVKISIANAVTGVGGEARIWPLSVGRYRAKLKWVNEGQQ